MIFHKKETETKIELVTRPVTTDNSSSGQVSTAAGGPLTDMSKLLLTQAPVVAPHLVAQNSSLPNLSSTASVQPSLTTSRITATSSPGIVANTSNSIFFCFLNQAFFGHFEKTQGQKNSSPKKTQANFRKTQ